MKIIGFSGKIGSGKTTGVDYLKSRLEAEGKKVQLVSFADRLRDVVSTMCDVPVTTLQSQEGKNSVDPQLQMTYGVILQKVGTGMRKEVDQQIWVKLALDRDFSGVDFLLVGDMRFENEADAIRERGGLLVRVEGDPAGVRANSKRDLNHISETALDTYAGFNVMIYNDSGIDDYYKSLDNVLQFVLSE
jgi:hypothetical protein